MRDFYAMKASLLYGGDVQFDAYEGQVVLIVNTASLCGFTPQYAGLEALYRKYRDRGFVILGFPCNQFGRQEPGDAGEIGRTCYARYGVSFPMFAKIEVNGPQAHPLFAWLTAVLPGWLGGRVRWNFTKFLLDREGRPLRRFAPYTKPAQLDAAVAAAVRSPP